MASPSVDYSDDPAYREIVRAARSKSVLCDCYASYCGGRWQALAGSPSVHWLAHQLGVRRGMQPCLDGYATQARDVLWGRQPVGGDRPLQLGDIFVSLDELTLGRVVDIERDAPEGVRIAIEHHHRAGPRVSVGDFYATFAGAGRFVR